jgi:hypothetical protein
LPNEILISEQTLQAIDNDVFEVGDSRTLNAKGMEGLLTVYPVIGVNLNG